MDKPSRRIRFETDYPEPDVVELLTGEFKRERGYLIAGEDGTVRFVPEFERESDPEEQQ